MGHAAYILCICSDSNTIFVLRRTKTKSALAAVNFYCCLANHIILESNECNYF